MPIDNRPLELFGFSTDDPMPVPDVHWSALVAEDVRHSPYKDFPCPFRTQLPKLFEHTSIGLACDKIRKASPNPLIGNCSMRKTSRGNTKDWIVCPHRFIQDKIIFDDCKYLLKPADKYSVYKELPIGRQGNSDFVLASQKNTNEVNDFLAIEVQACGTGQSGAIWDARNDYLSGRMRRDYQFSLNTKDASKKILVQLLHKSRQIARWRKNTVLVIQNHFLDHLKSSYNLDAHFHNSDAQDFVHIHSYRLDTTATPFTLRIDEKLSTDLVGLSMVLISNPTSGYSDISTLEQSFSERDSENKKEEI